jgi:hypothetical protein
LAYSSFLFHCYARPASGTRLDLDEGPIDDDEPSRHVSGFEPQGPQRQPIGGLTDLVGLTDWHGKAVRFADADRPGDLAVADATLLASDREVFHHAVYCTEDHHGRQESKALDRAILA